MGRRRGAGVVLRLGAGAGGSHAQPSLPEIFWKPGCVGTPGRPSSPGLPACPNPLLPPSCVTPARFLSCLQSSETGPEDPEPLRKDAGCPGGMQTLRGRGL